MIPKFIKPEANNLFLNLNKTERVKAQKVDHVFFTSYIKDCENNDEN